MISKAFVEENGNLRVESEMRVVYDELMGRNFPVELCTEKRNNHCVLWMKGRETSRPR